jgi:MerR family mercuric resistance operon transcriptional regulator
MKGLTIGKAAEAAGVTVEAVRFYERTGVIEQPPKGVGYRTYPPGTVARIRFVRQAQRIGFSLREAQDLLALRTNPNADCASVRDQARNKIAEIDEKISELLRMRAALEAVVASCPGQGGLEACAILEALDDRPAGTAACRCDEPKRRTTR